MKPLAVIYRLLIAAAFVFLAVGFISMPPQPTPADSPTAPTSSPTRHIPDPTPETPCYGVHKFCVGLKELEEEIVDREGQPVDDTHDGRAWRVVTATMRIGLRQGESKGSFGGSSVALIDTHGAKHAHDNDQVGLEDQHVIFDRTNRRTVTLTYVFILDEDEEVDHIEVYGNRYDALQLR